MLFRRHPALRVFAFGLSLAALDGCTSSAPIDRGACGADVSRTGACTEPNTFCRMAASCAMCDTGRFISFAATCSCSEGHWFCTVPGCSALTVGVFADPACTVPLGMDAGVDAIAATDAGDASMDAQTVSDATDVADASIATDVRDDSASGDACPSASDVYSPNVDGGCSPGRVACGASCVDLTTDPRNCGACGNECLPGSVCAGASCACGCSAGRTSCRDGCNACLCTDLSIDSTHCGSCGTACAAGQICVAGACQ